jgi:hypothetical protein
MRLRLRVPSVVEFSGARKRGVSYRDMAFLSSETFHFFAHHALSRLKTGISEAHNALGQTLRYQRVCCCAAAGLIGLLPFFSTPEEPQQALSRFVNMFLAQDAGAVLQILHSDIVNEKDIRVNDVAGFLKRFPTGSLIFKEGRIDERFKSEDGKTERFKATLIFLGPTLAPKYPERAVLHMTLLWVMEEGKWWLERPLNIGYTISAAAVYPTTLQEETAQRFLAALAVLDGLGLPGAEDLQFLYPGEQGTAVEQYKELENLYRAEKGSEGVDPGGRGVQVLLKAATKSRGGLLQIYHEDFKKGPEDKRKPVPWEMFKDYVEAAVKHAKFLERREKTKQAETIYRGLIAIGRQFVDEPGGFQFMNWGLTFQKMGAQELSRILPTKGAPSKQTAKDLVNLTSRRIDLLQTAFACMDDMADYKALKAAIVAAGRSNDQVFRAWGINTLVILALKGAPADPETVKSAGAMALVTDLGMQQIALAALERLGSEPTGELRQFIDSQKEWVKGHQVYGTPNTFR